MNLVLLYIFDISFKSPSFLGEKFFNFIFSSPLSRVLKAYIFVIVSHCYNYCMAIIIKIIKKNRIFYRFRISNREQSSLLGNPHHTIPLFRTGKKYFCNRNIRKYRFSANFPAVLKSLPGYIAFIANLLYLLLIPDVS